MIHLFVGIFSCVWSPPNKELIFTVIEEKHSSPFLVHFMFFSCSSICSELVFFFVSWLWILKVQLPSYKMNHWFFFSLHRNVRLPFISFNCNSSSMNCICVQQSENELQFPIQLHRLGFVWIFFFRFALICDVTAKKKHYLQIK